MRDAPLAQHSRRLDDDKAGAGMDEGAQMLHVPVVGGAVIGAVLAHRRHDDAIGEREPAQGKRREKSARHDHPLL